MIKLKKTLIIISQIKETVNKALKLTIEDGIGVGLFVFSARILDEAVRLKDVISNLLAPFGGFAGAEFVDRFGVLLELHLDQFTPEDFHGFFLILELGALVLNGDDRVGWKVGDADGGIGRVNRLATVATRVVDVDTKVFFVDFDVGVGLDNRENFN